MTVSWDPHKKHACHDCDVLEGEFHSPGCDMEICPFCHEQLISCDCTYKKLEIDVSPGTWAYENGLTEEQELEWSGILEKKGLIPFFQIPWVCVRCGVIWPELFMRDDWLAVIPYQYADKILCFDCYEFIKSITTRRVAASGATLTD